MSRLGNGGNCKDVDAATGGGGELLPNGWYRFMFVNSQYKATKVGDGMCLHLFLRCLELDYQGIEKRDFLTLEHPKQDTALIARASLKAIAIACGHPNPDLIEDSADLHQIPFMARLSVEDAGDKYGPQNKVRQYMSVAAYREKYGNGPQTAAHVPPARPAVPAPRTRERDDVPF
jgi:hypothetical protein